MIAFSVIWMIFRMIRQRRNYLIKCMYFLNILNFNEISSSSELNDFIINMTTTTTIIIIIKFGDHSGILMYFKIRSISKDMYFYLMFVEECKIWKYLF